MISSPSVSLLSVVTLVLVMLHQSVDASSLAATTDKVWGDEFTTLLRTNWNVATSDSFVPSAGIQTFTSDNVAIYDKDYLTITADKTSSTSFESGQVDTYNKVHFQYCTVTARIKIPNTTTGLVPTFYTQGVNSSKVWPHNGEIDIMKVGQGNASATGSGNERTVSGIHYINGDGNYYSNTGSRDCGTDLSSNYYIYTLDWTPTSITTFYNDRQVWTTDIGNCNDNDDCTEFHQPHYMLFHMSVGGSFPSNTCTKLGAASASGGTIPNTCSENDQLAASDITAAVPATMSVDWVRIYDNGFCQLTMVDNDGSNSIPETPVTAPIESDTGASNPVPIGSSTGGSAGSPAGSNTGGAPGLSPTGSNTAPGGSSPVGSDSGVKYTFPPNLSPIGSDSGGSSGLAPSGSDSGGSSGISPTGSDSGGSSGLSPTGSVTSPGGGSAPVPVVSIPIPPAPVAVPVPVPVPVNPPVVPPVNPPLPVTAPALPPVSPPVMPRPVQPPVSPPAITPPTVSVVQPPPVVDGKKGKKKCKEKKTVSPPGVVTGDGTGTGKGSGKGDDSGVVTGSGSSSSGKGGGKGSSSSSSSGGGSDSGVTGDSNTTDSNTTNSNVFAPSPSYTSGSNVDSPSSGYRYRQRQRRAGQAVTVTSKQQARRQDQSVTPNSVGGGNTANSTDPDVISTDSEDELECEETDADALSVDSSSRCTTTFATLTMIVASMIAYMYDI